MSFASGKYKGMTNIFNRVSGTSAFHGLRRHHPKAFLHRLKVLLRHHRPKAGWERRWAC